MKVKFTLLFVFCSLLMGAQSSGDFIKKAQRELSKKYPDYVVAEGHLKEAKTLDAANLDIDYLLALTYVQEQKLVNALPYVETIISSGEPYNEDFDFIKGEILQLKQQFGKAKASFELYKSKLTPAQLVSKDVLAAVYFMITRVRQGHTNTFVPYQNMGMLVDCRISQCESGSHLTKNEKFVKIENLGFDINSKHDEYAPVYSKIDSTLYFTSRRPIPNNLRKDAGDELFLEHIFEADHKKGTWSRAMFEEEPLNSFTHNVSALMISEDGKDLYLFDHRNKGDIMHSLKKSNGGWTQPTTFDEVFNSENVERSFTINHDQTLAFLERDNPKDGNRDLFFSIKENGKWTVPAKASEVLNSPFDEDGVYLSYDGNTLYYSSNGVKSMGGYDIFKSEWNGTEWGTPQNMGYPINSVYDDIFFIISRDEKLGFFSSNRPGGQGGFDVYTVNLKPNPLSQKLICSAYNEETGAPILDAEVVIKETKTGKTYNMTHTGAGNYALDLKNVDGLTDYTVIAGKENFEPGRRNINLNDSLTTFDAGKLGLKEIKPEIAKFVFNDVYLFELNSSKFIRKNKDRLQVLIDALKIYDVTIMIEGHTDNSGSEAYNLLLSEARAQSVKDYLVSQGARDEQVIISGKGESKPLNNNSSGSLRKLNRRAVVTLRQD